MISMSIREFIESVSVAKQYGYGIVKDGQVINR